MPGPSCELPAVDALQGGRGRPFGAARCDLGPLGYVEAEYSLTGSAHTFDLGDSPVPRPDGYWAARPARRLPYRTRVLVRRPADPDRFNGTVLAIWTNVSLGWDLADGESPELLESGFAVVVVSAQRAGLHGLGREPAEGLVAWDPGRYGELSIPTDDLSYDIFSQALRVIGPDRPRVPLDPMGGLEVRHLLATGSSQGSVRLATCLNAVQPLEQLVDGFLLELYVGAGSPLASDDPNVDWPQVTGGPFPPGWHRLRTDTRAKVLVLNSESDATCHFPVRQRDDDSYRLWEVAGTAHSGKWAVDLVHARYQLEFGRPFPGVIRNPHPNVADIGPARDAAFHHLHRWVNGEGQPPSIAPIRIEGDPPVVCRDGIGTALDGYRLLDVEVPLACHAGHRSPTGPPTLTGMSRPLDPDQLRGLYGSPDGYAERVAAAAARAVQAGTLLPRDAARACRAAAAVAGF